MPRARSKVSEYQQSMSSRPKMRGTRLKKKHNKNYIKNESEYQDLIEKEHLLSKIKELEDSQLMMAKLSAARKAAIITTLQEQIEQKKEFSKLTQKHTQTSKALEEWKKTGIRFHVLHKEIEKLGGTDNTDVMASLVDLMTDIEVPDYGEKAKYHAGVNSSYEPPTQYYRDSAQTTIVSTLSADTISHPLLTVLYAQMQNIVQ